MNSGNAEQAENRIVRGVFREAVPGPQKAGARSAVSAHGSGRGSSRAERKEQIAETADRAPAFCGPGTASLKAPLTIRFSACPAFPEFMAVYRLQ